MWPKRPSSCPAVEGSRSRATSRCWSSWPPLSRDAPRSAHRAPWSMRGGAPTRIRWDRRARRSEEHTSELQSLAYLVCRLLLEKKKTDSSETCDPDAAWTPKSLQQVHLLAMLILSWRALPFPRVPQTVPDVLTLTPLDPIAALV